MRRENLTRIEMPDGTTIFVDKNGNRVSPINFICATDFQNGFACVQLPNEKWNFLRPDGSLLSSVDFLLVDEFSPEGVANVVLDDNQYRVIDKFGRLHQNAQTAIESLQIFSEIKKLLK